MSEIVNNKGQSALVDELEEASLEGRLFRSMVIVVAAAVLVSLIFAPWRVTTGLLLGGVLAFFNHHWLRTSLGAMLNAGGSRLVAARYVLRYAVVALVVAAAYVLDLVSLWATLAGICSFAAAIMLEAMILLFRAIVYGGGD
jgi:hypothetical protein